MALRLLMFFSFIAAQSAQASPQRGRSLRMEPLEKREVLSSTGLVEVGTQPSGALDDKIVYIHAGHGYTANGSGWGYQRPLLLDMVEDLGNQDQMTLFADELWRAGATVVPLRPVGHQPNEVIVDNVDAGVTFTGAWSDSSSTIYFGEAGELPYRFATTSLTETATAQYRPTITEEGFYPVYAWTRSGSDRAPDQLYRVHHSGGATEVTVNHRRVGNGLVYLGTFHFEEGNAGFVEISNRSSEAGRVVIADMIRFGNGIGDLNFGNGVSGEVRENEAGLYWLQWHVERSQGVSSSTYGTSTVTAPNRYAAYMNRAADGSPSDRVFVSYHSNATTGNPNTASARGVIALHNTPNGGNTPNQLRLAQDLAIEINNDLVAQNGQFEHNWQSRSSLTFAASFNYGEINNSIIGGEFDATIIETGFHDNTLDAEMLRDPRVRQALAKSSTQGLVNFFRFVDGGATPDIDLPPTVTSATAESTGLGEVRLDWVPGTPSSYAGAAPTGFMVYTSTNGYGFDGGTFVAGANTTTHTLTGLDPNETYYFKIAAVNDGGEALGSEVVAARPSNDSAKILIVNGFDRIERTTVDEEPFRGSSVTTVDRVRPRLSNSMDYAVQIGEALAGANADASVSTVSNEQLQAGVVPLGDYDAVFWIAGEESTTDETFNNFEQLLVTAYLQQGGKLFVSGSEIGWDLEAQGGGATFYNGTLRTDYIADDANTYTANGSAGSIFEGLAFDFDDGQVFYDVNFPDVIAPSAGSGATLAATYNGGGGAGVQYDGGVSGEKVVMLGFPFETVLDADTRVQAMGRVLDFFEIDNTPPIIVTKRTEIILNNDDGAPTFTTSGVWLNNGTVTLEFLTEVYELAGSNNARATWTTTLPEAGRAEVFVIYTASELNATSVNYDVTTPGGAFSANVNQQTNSRTWVSLGSVDTGPGQISISLDADQSSPVIDRVLADAVRIFLDVEVEADADFNGSGVVDIADYTVWRDSLGQTVTPGELGDADFDGVVTNADYDIWVATFGQTVSLPAFATATAAQPFALVEGSEAADSEGVSLPFALALAQEAESAVVEEPVRRGRGAGEENARSRRMSLLLAARAERVASTLADDLAVTDAESSDDSQASRREAFGSWSRFGRQV